MGMRIDQKIVIVTRETRLEAVKKRYGTRGQAKFAMVRAMEVEASYNSARSFGFDELIDPRETRNILLHSLERSLYRRQAVPEPVARIGIMP